jgi:predicted helicase
VLKKELPRVPLLPEFGRYAAIGRALAGLHVHYEHVAPYPLAFHWKTDRPVSWRVEKMKLAKDKAELQVNDALTLGGIPPEVSGYRLGNRSALEWVVDQYRVDPKTGEDPNRPDDPEYIVRLVQRVVTVSLRTVALVSRLPAWPADPSPALEPGRS